MGFSALITSGRQQLEDKSSVYIADVQTMTEAFLRRLQKNRVSHDGDAGGVSRRWVTPPQPRPEAF